MTATSCITDMLSVFLLSGAFFLSGTGAVRIQVTAWIRTDLYQQETTLPCNFTLQNPYGKYIIGWSVNNVYILKRSSKGKVTYNTTYDGRAHIGDGCSLVLLHTQLNDTGNYLVSIVAPKEEPHRSVKRVYLVVSPQTSSTKTFEANVTTKPNDKACVKDDTESKHWSIVLSVISALGFFIQFYLLASGVYVRARRDINNQSTANSNNHTRKIEVCKSILPNVSLVFFTAAFVTSTFVEWNTITFGTSVFMILVATLIMVYCMVIDRDLKKDQ